MSSSNHHWLGVTDMMSGLMMVFLLISVTFMLQVNKENESVQRIAHTYRDYQEELYNSLLQEFQDDLLRWHAGILPDGTVRFYEPDVLFDDGSKQIKPKFQAVLAEFFPRYIRVLGSERYRDNIEEVRIEGHTSSTWVGTRSLEERYLNNALLSQGRSFVILDYCFRLASIEQYRPWLTQVLRANGLAFAVPVVVNGKEDRLRSRRVEFKVRTKAEEKIREIIQTLNPSGGRDASH